MTDIIDFVIIGGDAAGLSAAVQIRTHLKNANICILEKSNIISYGACGLPYVIQGIIPELKNLIHFSPDQFKTTYKCELITEAEATGISHKDNTVLYNEKGASKSIKYNKLLIATGARPVRLPIFNYESPRVFELKTIHDADRLLNKLNELNTAHITIIGAGYIGLELAEALTAKGKQITIIDLAPRPVERMPEKVSKAAAKILVNKKIEFLPNTYIKEVKEHSGSMELFHGDTSLHTNAVVVAVGIKPATEFLQDSFKNQGNFLNLEKGVISVNSFCKTTADNIYAAGDCASVNHILLNKNVYLPLGSTANKQGRIAGLNMAGVLTEFPGIIGTRIFKFFESVFAATGLSVEEANSIGLKPTIVNAQRNSKAGYYPGGDMVDVNLVIDEDSGIILGGFLIGPLESAGIIDTIGVMAQMKMKASDAGWFDSAYAPPFAPVWNAYISAAGKFNR